MNFQFLTRVIQELAGLISGARVERIFQGSGSELYIILGRDRRKFVLLLSPDRSLPRIYLVTNKPTANETTNAFTLYLRSHLVGGRIMNIAILNEDRLVAIKFTKQATEYTLMFELFGSMANLIFLDFSSKILSVFHPVPPAEHVARPLLPGLTYHTPEKKLQGKRSAQEADFEKIGPNLGPNNAAEQYYRLLIEHKMDVSLQSELRSHLRNALAKSGRLADALAQDLLSAERFEDYRRLGDLILANLAEIRPGTEQVALRSYDGMPTIVPLDPKRSPAQNAELYFKKYKKAKAGRNIITARLSEIKEESQRLESLLFFLDHAKNRQDLFSIRAELVARGYIKTAGAGRSPRAEDGSPVYRKIQFLGWEILVGKSAAGNDYITMKIARPDDLWLHAEGLPGSHVLVRNFKSGDIPHEVLMKAASLAAYFSKGKNSGKVPVTYTRAGFVRKPKGAKPGTVLLTERKSIMVKPQNG